MLGDRLKKLRETLQLTQAEMAGKLELQPSAISQMENNRTNPSLETFLKFSDSYGVNLHWLITGQGSMFGAEGEGKNSTEHKLTKIRDFLNEELLTLVKTKEELEIQDCYEFRVSGEIAAGLPAESVDTSMDLINVRRGMIHGKVADYICLRVNGHSMEPVVSHNDIVIIRSSQNWDQLTGQICALRIDGAITLKRLTLDERRKLIVLVSINEEYQPILIDPQEHQDVTLIGTLCYLYRKM